METFGERIVNARNRKGYSQETFAEKLGVSRQTVSKWELNTAVPRMSRIEKICELLDLTVSELIHGGDSEIDESEENKDNSTNNNEVALKNLKIKAFLKRTALSLLKIFIVLFILYILYSIFKLVVLKNVINHVSKYENLDNYYCKIISNDEYEMDSIKEIWYKNNVYKIIETIKINDTDVKTILIVDLNNKCRYLIDENTKTARKRNLIDSEQYENGRFMYSNFPVEISNDFDYMSVAFKINKLLYYKKDNRYCLEINNVTIHLKENTYLPVFNNIKSKNKKGTQSFSEYDIKLDVVENEDVQIPDDYMLQ